MKKTTIINDSLFKRIYGSDRKESRRSLRYLLETFLDMKVHTIELLSSNVTTGRNDKQMIADVLLLVNNKHFVILEMQNQRKGDDNARFTSYESVITMFREDRGMRYDEGKNIILVFTGYHVRKDRLLNESIICHRYNDGYIYSDKYIIKVVELVGLSKLAKQPVANMTSKERYKLFLRYMNKEQYPQYVNLIKEIVNYEEELKMTLTDLIRTTSKEDLPHELLRWKNEEQIKRQEEYEDEKMRRERARHKRAMELFKKVREEEGKLKEMSIIVKEEENKLKQAKEELKLAEQKAKDVLEKEKSIEYAMANLEKVIQYINQGMTKEEAFKKVGEEGKKATQAE